MCRDAALKRPVNTKITVSFFLRNPCTSVYDVRSDDWVDLRHKTKRCLSCPQLAEEYKNSLGSRLKVYISLKLTPDIQRMPWCHRLPDSN